MKKNTLYFIITILLLLNLFTFFKLNNLKNNINNRFEQSEFEANSLRNEINNIYSNVETKIKKQGSILDNTDITFGELNPSNLTIPVTLIITPKEYPKGLTASLQLNDKSVLMKNDGTSFVATVDAYIFDEFNLKVDLEGNGVKKIETIEEYSHFSNKYLLDINGGFTGNTTYGSEEYDHNGKIDLNINSSQANSAEKISIIYDVNGVIVSEQKIDPSNVISIDVKENNKLATGDKLTIYAMVQDRYGLNYKYIIYVFEVYKIKEPYNGNYQQETQTLAEITDKNGKVLYAPKNE